MSEPHLSPRKDAAYFLSGALESGLAASLSGLYDELPLAVLLTDAQGRIVYANPRFFTLSECTPSDLELMHFQDLLSVFCLGLCRNFQEIHEYYDAWHDIEKPLSKADGSLAWDRVQLKRLKLGNGQVYDQLLLENVTQYKVAIEGLISRKNLYQSIVDTRPDVICCFLPDWSLTYLNPASRSFFAAGRESVNGESLLSLLPPTARDSFAQAVDAVSVERPIAELEIEGPRDEFGRPSWMRWIIQGFFYKSGFIKDYQATGIDVSAQKVSESQVIHADRLVSLGTLVSEVAHEISNPNNFIMLNAPLALDIWQSLAPLLRGAALSRPEELPPGLGIDDVLRDFPQLMQGIVDGSSRIKNFVRELKNYARKDAESGFELVSLNEVVQSAVLLLNKTIGRHTSRFRVRYGQGLPLVKGRRQRLEQVVVNLLQNACHALSGPEQGIEIETLQAPPDRVLLAVRDQGVGISPEDLPKVTDPFYSTKRGQGGTGLGLSISLCVAREHGGELSLESRPGQGTTATLALPAARGKTGAAQ